MNSKKARLIAVFLAIVGMAVFCFGVAYYATKMDSIPAGYPWPDYAISRPPWVDIAYVEDYIAQATQEAINICSVGGALVIAGCAVEIWKKRRYD